MRYRLDVAAVPLAIGVVLVNLPGLIVHVAHRSLRKYVQKLVQIEQGASLGEGP